MSVDAHIQQLKQRHQSLESELSTLKTSPSVSDVEIAEVKRQKLRLKDQISRLKSA